MFDTKDALLAQIRLGEDSRLELKSVSFRGDRITGPHPDSLADEIAAFANSAGGVLVLGMNEETGKASGMSIPELNLLEQGPWGSVTIPSNRRPSAASRNGSCRMPPVIPRQS